MCGCWCQPFCVGVLSNFIVHTPHPARAGIAETLVASLAAAQKQLQELQAMQAKQMDAYQAQQEQVGRSDGG